MGSTSRLTVTSRPSQCPPDLLGRTVGPFSLFARLRGTVLRTQRLQLAPVPSPRPLLTNHPGLPPSRVRRPARYRPEPPHRGCARMCVPPLRTSSPEPQGDLADRLACDECRDGDECEADGRPPRDGRSS